MNSAVKSMSMKRRWLIFALVFSLAVCATTDMTKASPIFLTLIPALGFTDQTIGWMVSCFSVMTVALAFPAGWAVRRFGVKRLLIISGCATILGSILGALATDVASMLFSRFVEGFGMGIVVVVGAVAVDTIMPVRVKGLAMGIWSIYFPTGILLSMLIAPAISNAFGWAAMWWLTALFGLVATAMLFLFYAEPKKEEELVIKEQPDIQQSQLTTSLKPDYRSILFVGLSLFAWNVFWSSGVNAFYPTYLQEELLVPNTTAGLMVAIPNFIVMLVSPIAGGISDRLGTRKWLIVGALAEVTILLSFAFSGSLTLAWVFIFAVSLAASTIPPGVFAIAPVLAKKTEAVGTAMAIVMFCGHSGILFGTAVFGSVKLALGGWQETGYFFILPIIAAGLVFSLLIKEKKVKKASG